MDSADKNLIALLNTGDRRELKAFLKLYSKPVYDRSLALTGKPESAYEVTRRVIVEVVHLARRGELREDIDAQLMAITDSICEEERYFSTMVNSTVDTLMPGEYPVAPAAAPQITHQTAPLIGAPFALDAHTPASTVRPNLYAPQPAPFMGTPPVDYAHYSQQTRPAEAYASTAGAPPPHYGFAPIPAPAYAEPEPARAATANADAPAQHDYNDTDDIMEYDEYPPPRKASPLLVILIFLLAVIVVALVWMLIVKLIRIGAIPLEFPIADMFGDWFNVNVFPFF